MRIFKPTVLAVSLAFIYAMFFPVLLMAMNSQFGFISALLLTLYLPVSILFGISALFGEYSFVVSTFFCFVVGYIVVSLVRYVIQKKEFALC